MDILPLIVAADNAAPDPVRPADTEFFTGAFTEDKFAAFLDCYPGRRRDFLAESPKGQARYRARIARLWALRASPLPAELHAAVLLADQLQERLEKIVATYRKDEGRRVLEAAGLRVPNPNALSHSWGSDHFRPPLVFARRLIRDVEEFSEAAWASLFLVLPDHTEEPLTGEAA